MQERAPRQDEPKPQPQAVVPAYAYSPPMEDEISLRDIAAALGRRKRMIAVIVAACTLFGLLYAVFTQPLYSASVTVRPVSEEAGDALSGLRSQFGGAAALAGISLGGGASDAQEFIAILKSRDLGERFINEYGLKPYLFPDRWDAEAGAWKTGEPGLIGRAAQGVSRTLAWLSGDEGWRPPAPGEPSDREAYKEFSENVRSISEDVETGIVTLSFEFPDPERAAEWANAYVAMANADIRQDTVREASRALAYLNEQVQETNMAGLRETIFSIIQTQLERITLANARPQYAFKVLDPAVVPEERSHPKRALIVILSLILGGMLGVFAALAVEAWKGGIAGEDSGGEPTGDVV